VVALYLTTLLFEPKLNDVGSSTIGPFGYEELGSDSIGYVCKSYSSEQLDLLLDGPWKAARAFAVMAQGLVGATMLFLIFASCVSYSTMALYTIAGLSFSGSVSLMLTFVMFASSVAEEQNGHFHVGGGMALVGFICSATTGFLVLQIGPPGSSGNYIVSPPGQGGGSTTSGDAYVAPPPRRNFPAPKRAEEKPEAAPEEAEAFQPGTETLTETNMPDGSRKIIKTTVEPDGSKTITETIVQQQS
jgi:hypothetical protein